MLCVFFVRVCVSLFLSASAPQQRRLRLLRLLLLPRAMNAQQNDTRKKQTSKTSKALVSRLKESEIEEDFCGETMEPF
jgi:hypothetical protein